MGGIHPRSKKPVGERLARGAFNSVYGGTGSITGPTLASCAVVDTTLAIEFDGGLLRGDTLVLQPAFRSGKVGEGTTMSDLDDPDRVWPTGLTIRESEELHKHVIDGARVFFVISLIAHTLVYMYSPWLK
jgi:light-harvesting protein B-800-850 beta chain